MSYSSNHSIAQRKRRGTWKREQTFRRLVVKGWIVFGLASLVFGMAHLANEIVVENTNTVKAYDPLDNLNPALYRVCACESTGSRYGTPRQFRDGKVLIGTSGDRGMCQVNPFVHLKNAQAMGLDIDTAEGNIAYSNYLYKLHGLSPWSASKKTCWGLN